MSRMSTSLVALLLLVAAFLLVMFIKDSSPPKKAIDSEQASLIEGNLPEFQNWREFSSVDGNFRVLLPSLPQHVKDRFADPLTKEPRKYDAFVTIENGKPVFMISAITLPRDLEAGEETETVLKAIIDQILSKNENNELKSALQGKFRNFPSIDFSIQNGEATIAGKVFAYNKTLYILTMGNDSRLFNHKEMDFFTNSFEVLDKETKNK